MKKFPSFTEVSKIHTNDLEVINFMKRDAHKEILEAILTSGYYKNDGGYINFLIETVLINNYQNKLFEGTLDNDTLYASVLEQLTMTNVTESKLKDWFDNKVETVKKWAEEGKEKAKEKGYQFIEKLKGFGDIVNLIVKSIQGFLKGAWEFFKKAATSTMGEYKDHLVSKWKHWTESHEGDVVDEIKAFSGMSKHAVNWATTGFPKDASGAIQKAGNEEVEGGDGSEKKAEPAKESYNFSSVMEQSFYISLAELIKEDNSIIDEMDQFNEWVKNPDSINTNELNEQLGFLLFEDGHGHGEEAKTVQIPFIGKIAAKIGHLPPFKYLHNIETIVKEKTNNFFQKISIWLNKVAGGPAPFEYFYLGASLGLVAGAKIKSAVTDVIQQLGSAAIGVAIAAAIPGIGFVLTVLKYMAKGIWIVEVAQLGISAASETAAKKIKSDKGDSAGSDSSNKETKDENPDNQEQQ
jgi:hypothetical protein